jgi:hypothetical protein
MTTGDPRPLLVKETYWTLKKRVFDANTFMEVSAEGQKIIFNKKDVIAIGTEPVDNKKQGKKSK